MEQNSNKKLTKCPHVLDKLLELPLPSNADVVVDERPGHIKFIAKTKGFVTKTKVAAAVKAHVEEILPGISKINIISSSGVELFLEKSELNRWRFHLPPSAHPELATANLVDGNLVVTVPNGNGQHYMGHQT